MKRSNSQAWRRTATRRSSSKRFYVKLNSPDRGAIRCRPARPRRRYSSTDTEGNDPKSKKKFQSKKPKIRRTWKGKRKARLGRGIVPVYHVKRR
ncbi:Equilibrative nucleoside transporter [Trichinella spiralis]|nr:putative sperm-specific protein Phi-1 [Trichinella spiralis]